MKNIPLPLQLTFAIFAAFVFFNVLQADFSIDREAVVTKAIMKAKAKSKSEVNMRSFDELIEVRELFEAEVERFDFFGLEEIVFNPFSEEKVFESDMWIAAR